jgi:hypothetical protein
MQFDASALIRIKSKRASGSSSPKATKKNQPFREDPTYPDSDGALSDMKDLEADCEFEMLALDG